MSRSKSFVLMGVLFLFSCSFGCNGEVAHNQTVSSARQAVPVAVQMEELFGDCDHFITHFGFSRKTNQWNTEVFLYERYRLHMTVEVKINYWNRTVRQAEEPEFRIFETESVDDDCRGSSIGRQKKFGMSQWKEVFKSKGDFSAIGFPLKRNNPVKGYGKFVARIREGRARIKLSN